MKSPNNSDIPDVLFINILDYGLRASEANIIKIKLRKEEPIKKNPDRYANVLKIQKSFGDMRSLNGKSETAIPNFMM